MGTDGGAQPAAFQVAPPEQLPMAVVVAVTALGEKAISSTVGMNQTQNSSPYFGAWASHAPTDYETVRKALLEKDFAALGKAAECSAMRMHAAALGADPPILYWNPTTVAVLQWVWAERASGRLLFATIDAGPHVKILAPREQVDELCEALRQLPGVIEARATKPGGPAHLE